MFTNFRNKYILTESQKKYFYLSLPSIITSLILALVIFLFFKYLPTKMPLFYSLSWGEPQLVTHTQFYIIPASILLIALINLIILWKLPPIFNFFKKILIFSTIVTTIILTVTFVKVVLIYI